MIEDLERGNKIPRKILFSQKKIFCLLAAFVLLLPLLFNALQGKPLLMGEESYYHLVSGQTVSWQNWSSFPLHLFSLPGLREMVPFIFPLLGIVSVILLLNLFKAEKISPEFSFVVLLFLILSPVFIYSYSTISVFAFSFFLFLGGLYCWNLSGRKRYLAFIPFLLITTTNFLNAALLLLFLFYYLKDTEQQKKRIMMIVLSLSVVVQLLFFNLPFVTGPFHTMDRIRDLVADFGGRSGMGIFLILLAIPGLATLWKQKRSIYLYGIFLLALVGYLYNTEAILPLVLIVIYFATKGFFVILDRKWEIVSLQKVTAFIILLGLFFSTLTYLDRLTVVGPTAADREALTWVKGNTAPETVIFADLEESYFVQFFAQRETLLSPHQTESPEVEDYQTIFKATYIEQLFPVLEKKHISLLYISPGLKRKLSPDQGLLFLLQNERFKLVHSYEGAEVWQFKKDDSTY